MESDSDGVSVMITTLVTFVLSFENFFGKLNFILSVDVICFDVIDYRQTLLDSISDYSSFKGLRRRGCEDLFAQLDDTEQET